MITGRAGRSARGTRSPRRSNTVRDAAAKRRTALLLGCLAAVTAVSWAYLFEMARDMDEMCHCAVMMTPGGAGMSVRWMLVMWVVMMAAMMVPTAVPMTLLFARFRRGRLPDEPALAPSL